MPHRMTAGRPAPLGATPDAHGVNFAVFSAHAARMVLCLFAEDGQEVARLDLPERDGDVWHGHVAGLRPGDVSVIDAASGRVLGPEETPSGSDRAAELRGNVERLLAARVGPGRSVVEVSVETATEREQIVERRLDPQGRLLNAHLRQVFGQA